MARTQNKNAGEAALGDVDRCLSGGRGRAPAARLGDRVHPGRLTASPATTPRRQAKVTSPAPNPATRGSPMS